MLTLPLSTAFCQLKKADIAGLLRKKLQGYERIDYEIVSSPKLKNNELVVLDEKREIKIASGMGFVPIEIVQGSFRTKAVITLRLKLFKKVAVAINGLKRGEILAAGMLDYKLEDVTSARGEVVEDMTGIIGLRSKGILAPGEILTKESLEAAPIIRTGDAVMAYLQKGSVVVTTEALAREDGYKGKTIRIMTKDKKILRASIIDAFSVKIIE